MKGINKVIFETDSLLLKQAMEGGEDDLSPVCFALADLKEYIAQNIYDCVFSFCNRSCNQVAHSLAAYGCTLNVGDELCSDNVIPNIQHLVVGDLAPSTK